MTSSEPAHTMTDIPTTSRASRLFDRAAQRPTVSVRTAGPAQRPTVPVPTVERHPYRACTKFRTTDRTGPTHAITPNNQVTRHP